MWRTCEHPGGKKASYFVPYLQDHSSIIECHLIQIEYLAFSIQIEDILLL